MLNNTIKALIFAALCIIVWSLIPVVSKLATSSINPLNFLFLSNIISFFTIFILIKAFKVKDLKNDLVKGFKSSFLPGFLGCFFYYMLLYYAYSKLQNAIPIIVIQYTWPAIIVFLAPLIVKDTISKRAIFSIILGFISVVFVATKGNFNTMEIENFNILFMVLIAAFAYAIYSLLAKKITTNNPLVAVLLMFFWGLVASLIAVIFSKDYSNIMPNNLLTIISLLINGIFVNGISYFWWLRAFQLECSCKIAPMVFFTPVLATIWMIIFFNEKFYFSYFISIVLCVLAGFLTIKTKSNAKKQEIILNN